MQTCDLCGEHVAARHFMLQSRVLHSIDASRMWRDEFHDHEPVTASLARRERQRIKVQPRRLGGKSEWTCSGREAVCALSRGVCRSCGPVSFWCVRDT